MAKAKQQEKQQATSDDSTNFADILKMKTSDIKAPPVIPEGHYVVTVGKFRLGQAQNENKTPFANWDMAPKQPCVDVDIPEEGLELTEKKLFKKFWITKEAVVRQKKFLTACGVDCEDSDDELLESMKLAQGAEVIVYVRVDENDQEEKYNLVGEAFVSIEDLDTING